jgi:hypothetical protein
MELSAVALKFQNCFRKRSEYAKVLGALRAIEKNICSCVEVLENVFGIALNMPKFQK